jgi:hypothetical protein
MATLYYLGPTRLNDSLGNPAANAVVTVTGGTAYQDPAGAMPYTPSVITTDANGDISFYAAAGTYTLSYTPVSNSVAMTVTEVVPSGSAPAALPTTANLALRSMVGWPATVVRSNLEFGIYSGPAVDTASLGGTTSGVMIAVPVPVDVGMTVTYVSVLIGATAASTPTHGFAALYSGTAVASPPLIGQSTDGGTSAMPASTRFDYTLTSATTITSAMAPYGYVWAAVCSTVTTTVASAITVPCGAAACQYRWFSGTPLYWSITSGSGLTTTAPSTLIHASTLTVAPIAFLR